MRSPVGGGAPDPSPVRPVIARPPASPGEEGPPDDSVTSSPGHHLCWQCERWPVDDPGDFCDECLDRVMEELEARGL